MELLDIVDLRGEPTGDTVERETAHAEGIRHRTSHVWIYRKDKGQLQLLLQLRCKEKDSYPGCYDISSAGHIPAGASFEESAIRELREELGIEAKPEALVPCGLLNIHSDSEFHGRPYHDRQITKVFVLRLDGLEEADFTPQESEIESVMWIGYEECKEAVRSSTIPHCIHMHELEMLEEKMK